MGGHPTKGGGALRAGVNAVDQRPIPRQVETLSESHKLGVPNGYGDEGVGSFRICGSLRVGPNTGQSSWLAYPPMSDLESLGGGTRLCGVGFVGCGTNASDAKVWFCTIASTSHFGSRRHCGFLGGEIALTPKRRAECCWVFGRGPRRPTNKGHIAWKGWVSVVFRIGHTRGGIQSHYQITPPPPLPPFLHSRLVWLALVFVSVAPRQDLDRRAHRLHVEGVPLDVGHRVHEVGVDPPQRQLVVASERRRCQGGPPNGATLSVIGERLWVASRSAGGRTGRPIRHVVARRRRGRKRLVLIRIGCRALRSQFWLRHAA